MQPSLRFGHANHESTRVIFGAAALFRADEGLAEDAAAKRLAMQPLFVHGHGARAASERP